MARLSPFILGLLLLCTATARAAGFPEGTYALTVNRIVWRIDFHGGRYTVSENGQPGVEGRYYVRGSRITLTDTGGPRAQKGSHATGTYAWRLEGTRLVFQNISDWGPRMAVLTAGPFVRK